MKKHTGFLQHGQSVRGFVGKDCISCHGVLQKLESTIERVCVSDFAILLAYPLTQLSQRDLAILVDIRSTKCLRRRLAFTKRRDRGEGANLRRHSFDFLHRRYESGSFANLVQGRGHCSEHYYMLVHSDGSISVKIVQFEQRYQT